MDIHHTAIEVSDLDATRAFYEDGLGLAYSYDFHTDDGVHNYYVTGETADTEIQFVHDPNDDAPIDAAGIVHLAILVDDADETFDRVLDRTDCTVVREPTTIEAANARAAFVEDPDGYEVELFSRLE
ncbi:VOC family protein [Halosolutus halophilus]|uniref:VOC family protein n=1 Tax=Halosolutus halophilus TaxID=1552990 RepID=UPI002234F39B|nr:VOC family protein [Halosolutus halophilus]